MESIHHVDLICNGSFNGLADHYICCNDSTNCNEHIKITLPIEKSTTTEEVSNPLTVSTTISEEPDMSPTNEPATQPETKKIVNPTDPAIAVAHGVNDLIKT